MDPKTSEEYQRYYTGRWHTLRQMAYTEDMVFDSRICKFLDKIKTDETFMDYGCGVGDLPIYLAGRGIKCFVVEVSGEKCDFLKYRFDKRKLDITVIPTTFGEPYPEYDQVDYTVASSILDHAPDPIQLARHLVERTRKEIYATPCINETYDRPCHVKEFLVHVPAAFDLIRSAGKLAEEIS